MKLSGKSLLIVIINVFIIVYRVCEANFMDSDDLSEKLNTLFLSNEQVSQRSDRIDSRSWFWEDYEFGSGVVAHEELQITDIQIWQELNLQQNIQNWQYLKHNDEVYIAGFEGSTLFLYHFDLQSSSVSLHANLSISNIIKSFKIVSFSSNNKNSTEIEDSIIAILSIENENGIQYLKWFYLQNHTFIRFWIWELLKTIKSLKYFNFDNKHRLLLLYEKDIYFNQDYSLVEIYDIKTKGQFTKQLCCQFLVSEVSDIQICPSQENTRTFVLIDNDYVTLHEYKESLLKCVLKPMKNITISNDSSTVCFESNNINHLAVSGSTTNFYKFHSNEYVYEKDMENLSNEIGKVNYVKTLPVDTYRDDVVLLIQSNNLTVFALCWQNRKFQFVRLPNEKVDYFDLSKVTIIPNYGFLSKNTFVKLKVELVQLSRPKKEYIENLSITKSILEDILETQESLISKTELNAQPNYSNDLKIENINISSEIDVDNLFVNEIKNFNISIESTNFTLEELQKNYEESKVIAIELRAEIDRIENQVESMMAVSPDNTFFEEITMSGNLEISGTITVENLFIDYLNNANVDALISNCFVPSVKIIGNKSFPSIKFSEGNLKIKYLNGVPIEKFQFDEVDSYYTDINFAKITKLEVRENLNFSKVNNYDWNILMDQLVFKNKQKVIPNEVHISGIMNTSFTRIEYLNDFKYPLDYVVQSGPENGNVIGIKTFRSLSVSDLRDVKTINGIDADEFIILTADQSLDSEIIFENLVIDESLQIDGTIIGLPEQSINPDLTLLNNNNVQSNVMFSNLYVSGNIYIENLIDGIEWSEMDDLILKNDKNVIVTGIKTFQDNVKILGNLEIKTSVINGHPVHTFMTLDSRQILPNLSKISGNIQFTDVSYEELEIIEDKLRTNVDELGVPSCLNKPFVFLEPPIVDEFSSSFINTNITGSDFSDKLQILLSDIHFLNLTCTKLIVRNLEPSIVNNINIKEFQDSKITKNNYQDLSGKIMIENLEIRKLHTEYINNRSAEDLKNTIQKINHLYKEVLNNEKSVNLLTINGTIVTPKINDENLYDILNLNKISGFLFETNKSIENLEVKGLINNLDFTKEVSDCVLKTENSIIIKGPKKIHRLASHNLKIEHINGHSVQDIVTDKTNQTLFASVVIKGSAYVSENYSSTGKINELNSKSIEYDIKKLNGTVYKLTGHFLIDNVAAIKNVVVAGRVQEKNVNEFLENLIYLNETNNLISSAKIFNDTIKFNDYVIPLEKLDDIDLELFYKNAISIDDSTLVNSTIIFENDVLLENDLAVINSLKVGTIKSIHVDNLMENAVYFNRPTSIIERVTLSNVVFKSDITVKIWNNTDVDMMLNLNKDQVIQNILTAVNIHAENLTIIGSVNNENLTKIYENTFMISTDQNISAKLAFLNKIYIHGNLESKYINDVDVTKTISLETSDQMIGNFVFDSPVVFNNNVILPQYLNHIDVSKWQSNAIVLPLLTKQTVFGNWTVHGNIDFEKNVRGSGFINSISIDSLSNNMKRQNEEIEQFISTETKNIQTICKDLQERKNQTESLLYKFKSFEYLRVLQFDKKIVHVHHFQFNDTDYILVNFDTCDVDIYEYTTEGFLLFANASNFGIVKHCITLNYKNNLYFVTAGKVECGRSSGNLWILENKQVKHVHDFGNITNVEQSSKHTFVMIVNHQVQEWSIKKVHEKLFEPSKIVPGINSNIRFLVNDTNILLASCETIYRFQNGTFEFDEFKNPFKSNEITSFTAGIHKKEYILLYDDRISGDHIFIYNQDFEYPRELQTIRVHKPNSFTVINFDGLYESFLLFSENRKEIQIYEYKGIEYFKFHSTIKMNVDKFYTFQLQTHSHFAKRHCIAIVHDFQLTILSAKMYGEKLNADNEIICSTT